MAPAKTASDAVKVDESEQTVSISLEGLDGILVDLDGVVTQTAKIHARAWKTMFDSYLRERAARLGRGYEPFDLIYDYRRYVDGKPRDDGVADFLQSRGFYLAPGSEEDVSGKETICGLGKRKNQLFLEAIRQHGVSTYRTSIEFIRDVKSHGVKVAVVTSSRNCNEVLEAAGVCDLFDAQVDGVVADEWMLAGKPAPDTYLEAARRLGVMPGRAGVIEDAAAGVEAGKAGRFGLVIGVDRHGQPGLLRKSGADIVVSDLSELRLREEECTTRTIAPLALENLAEIMARAQDRRIAVFLDYDGTLTPIVERPEIAVLPDEMRATLQALAACCTVVVISGRERGDVARLVGLDSIIYAGSHGFDIAGPKDTNIQHEEGAGYVPALSQAARELSRRLAPIKGVIVENKTHAVAVHFRLVEPQDVSGVERIVDGVLTQHPSLRKTSGKKVFELRPNIDWDKGEAVLWLLDALGLGEAEFLPFYFGDDVTDRDAFEALHGRGISILVAEQPQPTSADYRLSDTAEVRIFLNELAGALSRRKR